MVGLLKSPSDESNHSPRQTPQVRVERDGFSFSDQTHSYWLSHRPRSSSDGAGKGQLAEWLKKFPSADSVAGNIVMMEDVSNLLTVLREPEITGLYSVPMKDGQTINLVVPPQYSGKEHIIAEPGDVQVPGAGKGGDRCRAPSKNDIIWEGGLSGDSSALLKSNGGVTKGEAETEFCSAPPPPVGEEWVPPPVLQEEDSAGNALEGSSKKLDDLDSVLHSLGVLNRELSQQSFGGSRSLGSIASTTLQRPDSVHMFLVDANHEDKTSPKDEMRV